MDAITKRLWEQLEKELKELYDYIDSVAVPIEDHREEEDNGSKAHPINPQSTKRQKKGEGR